jgi:hypothetical protein
MTDHPPAVVTCLTSLFLTCATLGRNYHHRRITAEIQREGASALTAEGRNDTVESMPDDVQNIVRIRKVSRLTGVILRSGRSENNDMLLGCTLATGLC